MTDPGKGDTRTTKVDMQLSTFHLPPSGDVLVLGKHCAMGLEAATRMLGSVAPDQFECVALEDDIIEAIFIRKYLLLRANKDILIKTVLEESKPIMGPECMIAIKCDITINVQREI